MRILPILAGQSKDAPAQRTFWLLDLSLKADGGYPSETLYFSSQAVEFGGHFYEPRLKSKPQIRQTLGANTDGGTLSIDNTDLAFGQKILPKERFVEGSSAVIRFARKLLNGTIYADTVFDGVISGANLSAADGAVNLTLIGDLYQSNSVMGAYPLAQRCVLRFNAGGTLSPLDSPCGWQTIQGGNPLFCDKTEDGANGCLAHGNLHRIGAIPFFANVVVQITAGGGGIGSGGFPDSDSHPCFTGDSRVLLPDWSEMPIVEMKKGSPVMSFDEQTGELFADTVEKVHIHAAEEREILTVKFTDKIIRVTKEHPAYTDFNRFRAIGNLRKGDFVQKITGGNSGNYGWEKDAILSIVKSIEFVEVRNLSVARNQTFIVEKRGWHNVKPAYQVNI